MRRLSIIILVCLASTLPLFGDPAHLILYFDINKTLIASDKAGGKSVEDVLNELLAEQYEDCWDESVKKPISFYTYVYEYLVPSHKETPELRAARKAYLYHFLGYLKEHEHPYYRHALQEYQSSVAILNTSKIFPSFFHLVETLDCRGISYSIILRSFSDEVFEIQDEIEKTGQLRFQTGEFCKGIIYVGGRIFAQHDAIYSCFKQIGNAAIRDDFHTWHQSGGLAMHGKPFYIDRQDSDTLSIFFDDNINEDGSVKNIVSCFDAITGASIPIEELIYSGNVVRVDTLEAIQDINYYLNKIDNALIQVDKGQ